MERQVLAVESNGNKATNASAAEPGGSTPQQRPAAKFVYPGGSRPLSGYTIKRGVGHGGFGEIYYAVSDAGKEVALKLVRRNLDIELRGIRHCLNLKHPNLLDLYDIREDDQGDTWVVMEYVAGDCLVDLLGTHPDGLPIPQVLAWFQGIAAGVTYLHDRGIVHRDLKPGNIFSDEGLVKVGDYGLSKFVSCSRRSGQTESVGTVHYMAPEVANGRYGKEIDVYAMGVVLYEMLTGRVPFEGESIGEVLMKHLTAKPDVSMLAEPYRGVVARALEKDPAKRFNSMAEMQAALPEPAQAPPGAGRLPPGSYASAAAGPAAGHNPFAQTTAPPSQTDDEPISRAVRHNWSKLNNAWNEANLATPVKVIILVLGMCLLLACSSIWVPVAFVLLVIYAMYRIIRMIVLPGGASAGEASYSDAPPDEPPGPQTARAEPPPRYGSAYARTSPGRRGRWHRRGQAAAALVHKPPRERLTDLLGSLLAGALVAAAMCVVIVLLISYNGLPLSPELCAWLVLTSIAGTWAVLIPSKFWEGRRGEAILRRFVLMVVGLAVGALAFGLAEMLMVTLPGDPNFPEGQAPPNFYAADGHPLVMAYMACFGTLFLLLRWWRQADPLRSTRLSLWSLAVSALVAGLVAGMWDFPQPWLMYVAGAISVSVQLAGSWLHPHKRVRRQNA